MASRALTNYKTNNYEKIIAFGALVKQKINQ
jgi:hypothetical protein